MTDKAPPKKEEEEEEEDEEEEVQGKNEQNEAKSTKSGVVSAGPQPEGPQKKKNGCQKCCSKFMDIVVTDAIYGSFFGPHPVSFVCICVPCKRCVNKSLVAPFCVASVVTKVMNFVMFGIVALLAGFFIIPWPKTLFSHQATVISSFYPCRGGKLEWLTTATNGTGGCIAHAGHFMVYRCFLAFGTAMFTNNIVLCFISSSTEDPYRAKIHRGFWMYKYAYLLGLLLLFFLVLDGHQDKFGFFEYCVSLFGNTVHLLFSLITVVFIMDLAELYVAENRNSTSSWKNILYWIHTLGIFTADVIALIQVIVNFGFHRKFNVDNDWPSNNCEVGEQDGIDWKHTFLIIGMMGVIVILCFVQFAHKTFKERYPFSGWLQVAVLAGYDIFCLWSSLYNSPRVNSRPRCNWALRNKAAFNASKGDVEEHLQEGSWDIYYRHTGFLHGLLVIFTLIYYSFVHGPRSPTAPLSLGFRHLWGDKPRTPVYPDPDPDAGAPSEFLEKIETLDVWDDEQESVAQSWSKFYLVMALGGYSLMMAMTNFTDPWSQDKYNSSVPALGFKYTSGVIATVLYILFLILPCKAIHPGFETKEVVKTVRLSVDANNEENVLATEVVETVEVKNEKDKDTGKKGKK